MMSIKTTTGVTENIKLLQSLKKNMRKKKLKKRT